MSGSLTVEEAVSRGQALHDLLARREFASAVEWFDDTMKQAVPEEALAVAWDQIVGEAGDFRGIVQSAPLDEEEGVLLIVYTCAFERGRLLSRLLFDAEGRVTGLCFHAAQA